MVVYQSNQKITGEDWIPHIILIRLMRPQFFLFNLIVFCSLICVGQNEYSGHLTIKSTKHKIALPVPSQIINVGKCIQYYFSNNGRQYLFYMGDEMSNTIIIYDLDSLKINNQIHLERRGPNGIGNLHSFYVHNLDSIFLTTGRMNNIILINQSGDIQKRIAITNFLNGGYKEPYNFISHVHYFQNSMIFRGNKLYAGVHVPFSSVKPEKLEQFKTTLEIDLIHNKQSLLPMHYPVIGNRKGDPLYLYFSSIFTGNKFIYLFMCSNECLITTDHKNVQSKIIKSAFFKKDFKMPDINKANGIEIARTIVEHPCYINTLYDPYRKVIYRFCYPGVKTHTDDNVFNLNEFKPVFSIMILDTELNVLGETLMPQNTYNMNMAFVGKNGLYISTNHYLNPEYDIDSLKFELFNLSKNE